jgi:hypothetical protein
MCKAEFDPRGIQDPCFEGCEGLWRRRAYVYGLEWTNNVSFRNERLGKETDCRESKMKMCKSIDVRVLP